MLASFRAYFHARYRQRDFISQPAWRGIWLPGWLQEWLPCEQPLRRLPCIEMVLKVKPRVAAVPRALTAARRVANAWPPLPSLRDASG